MRDLAKQFTKEEIERALDHILDNNIKMLPSTKHDLIYKGKSFAPKEVVRWAARLCKLENWESYNLSGGENTNKPLRDLGFKIVGKDTEETSYFDKVAISELQERNNKKIQDSTLNKLNYLKDQLASELNVQLSDSDFYSNKKNDYLDIGFNKVENQNNPISVILGFFGSDEESEDYFFRLCVESKDGDFTEEVNIINENCKFGFDYHDFPDDWESLIDQLIIPFKNILNELPKSSLMTAEEYQKTQQPLNQILYGPPGTGKTYNTINTAVAIANPDFNLDQDRKIVKEEYQRLVDIGQIVFTTFHQSMSYEDFVEGIKPEVEENEEGDKSIIYNIKDGIFKTICTNAQKTEFDKQQVTSAYTFDDAFTALVKEANNGLQNNDPMFLPIQTQNLGLKIVGISDKGNLKLKPIYSDEAKEYTVSYSRAQKLQNAFPNLSVVKNIDKEFREVIGGSNSTAYWAVLNYINNKINENSSSEIVQTELPKKNYILIIDEINRGNVSQIFGELITLIEEDKRIGNDEVIQVTLPYSKTKFGVPKNLYIIGTMNTADKSVEALDAALRRRFVFHEMPPKYEELQDKYQNVFNYSAVDILKTVNERIEVLLNRDHLLGHAYFINKDAEALMQSFKKNIIPLLQEYFYGDYAKIGLVLGSGFIQPKSKGVRFANFTTQTDFDSYTDQELYEIKPINNLTDFEQALVQLMN